MSDKKPFPPVFATNRPASGETVADEVNRMMKGLREELAVPPNLALATAYINPQGFVLIADEVALAPRARILLGAEPDEPLQRRLASGEVPSFESVAAEYELGLRRERDLVGFDVQSDAAARALVAWLRFAEAGEPPRVEVRRFTKGFLHGKAFIAEHPRLPAVLAGSSNLTLAGLSWNRELNLGYPSGGVHRSRRRLVQRAVGRVRTVRSRGALRGSVESALAVGRVPQDAPRALRQCEAE